MENFISLLTGSPDCSILATDVETGSAIARFDNARAAVNRLINLTESTVATGDDEGCIKIQAQSEFSEDELLSVVIMKVLSSQSIFLFIHGERKIVCGSQAGTLLLYSWGDFEDCSDRFIDLSPNSIDAMLKLDEDLIITGSKNGLIK
ncbi:hypothetical protein K1719_012812 [Acacia pycnantha]|nr:hypothetical protein K1719_012812 [Acacia pycnantha]